MTGSEAGSTSTSGSARSAATTVELVERSERFREASGLIGSGVKRISGYEIGSLVMMGGGVIHGGRGGFSDSKPTRVFNAILPGTGTS